MRRLAPSNTADYVWPRFVVATTPFAVLGVSSAFPAILVGLAASWIATSWVVERNQLLDFWRNEQP